MRKPTRTSATRTKARGEDGRPEDDDYPTPPEATRLIIEREKLAGELCWEPFAGAGVLLNVARDEGVLMTGTTLVDYGHPDVTAGVDFRGFRNAWCEAIPAARRILTNPPFGLVDETGGQIVADMLEMADYVAILMPLSFLQSGGRFARVFCDRPPTRIYQMVDRLTLIPHRLWEGRDDPEYDQGAIPFAWFVWEKPYERDFSQLYFVVARSFRREHDLERYQVKKPEHRGRLHPRLI